MDFQIDETTARTIRLALGGLFGTVILAAIRPMKPVILKSIAAWSFSYVFGESVMHYFKIDPEHAIAVGGALSILGMGCAHLLIRAVDEFKPKDLLSMFLGAFGYRQSLPAQVVPVQDSAPPSDMISRGHAKLDRDNSQDPPVHS